MPQESGKNREEFQSTHPARGGTLEAFREFVGLVFQSTHPARGGTLLV